MIQKNQNITLTIDALGSEGQGIGRFEGMAVFVSGALPQETVEAHVIKVKKNYVVAKLETIMHASPDRVEPPCPVFGRCGGCALQHMNYAKQLDYKREWAAGTLERIGHIPNAAEKTRPVMGMEEPWRYRNKAAFPMAMDQEGVLQFGFYAPRSHRLVPIEDCLLQEADMMAVMRAIRYWSWKWRVPAYQEAHHTGILRHVVIRKGNDGSGMMVIVVTHTPKLPYQVELMKQLNKTGVPIKGILHSVQPKPNNVILGEKMDILSGENAVLEKIDGYTFTVSAQSFMQVNVRQTHILYQQAIDAANLTGNEVVVDAYCGIGTISLLMARHAKHVYGVEMVEQAVRDAQTNAKRNQCENVDFFAEAAEHFLPRWLQEGKTCDVLVLDPPRKGCDEKLLRAALDMRPERIVYVSCDVATLARDARILTETGVYTFEFAQPVDMFAQTANLETVALFQRTSPKA